MSFANTDPLTVPPAIAARADGQPVTYYGIARGLPSTAVIRGRLVAAYMAEFFAGGPLQCVVAIVPPGKRHPYQVRLDASALLLPGFCPVQTEIEAAFGCPNHRTRADGRLHLVTDPANAAGIVAANLNPAFQKTGKLILVTLAIRGRAVLAADYTAFLPSDHAKTHA